MSEPEPKGPSKPADAFPEVEGFGKPESKPDGTRRSRSRRDPSGVPLLGAVGPLQFEVVQFRLESEYGAESRL